MRALLEPKKHGKAKSKTGSADGKCFLRDPCKLMYLRVQKVLPPSGMRELWQIPKGASSCRIVCDRWRDFKSRLNTQTDLAEGAPL